MTSEQYAQEFQAVFSKQNDLIEAFNAGFECGRNATKEACIPIMWLAEHISPAYTFQSILKDWNKEKDTYGR